METPPSSRQLRPVRNPTPRLSERKKSLFSISKVMEDTEVDLLQGIALLDTADDGAITNYSSTTTPKRKQSIETLLRSEGRGGKMISFFEENQEIDEVDKKQIPVNRRSKRINLRNQNCTKDDSSSPDNSGKENMPLRNAAADEGTEEQLQKLFTVSMRLNGQQSSQETPSKNSVVVHTNSAKEKTTQGKPSEQYQLDHGAHNHKRHYDVKTSTGMSPKRKAAKVNSSISTKAFYSATKKSPTNSLTPLRTASTSSLSTSITSPRLRRQDRRSASNKNNINKGVRHKIRRPVRPFGAFTSRHMTPIDIDLILCNIRNEKLRNLIAAQRAEKVQIEKVHNIFRNSKNPIELARPLSVMSTSDDKNNNNNDNVKDVENQTQPSAQLDSDFSDIECESYEIDETIVAADVEELTPSYTLQQENNELHLSTNKDHLVTPKTNRKFFKSGRASGTRMEVTITGNIKASVCNGKISLVEEKTKKRKRIKIKNAGANEFSDEQATVDQILKNLDDTGFGENIEPDGEGATAEDESNKMNADERPQMELFSDELLNGIHLRDNTDYAEFRKRLPYNTNDPALIEQQHLLLDFLISNNICSEENFNIFITDPDSHKEEAARIVDQVVLIVNEQTDYRQRIPYNTYDSNVIAQQERFLEFLIENNICTEENFDIFIANYENRKEEATAIITSIEQHRDSDLEGHGTIVKMEENFIVEERSCSTYPISEPSTIVAPINNIQLQQGTKNYNSSEVSAKLFPIFYSGRYQKLTQKSTRTSQRTWIGGQGADQYQIDAGQKNFGAHQCKQCGLVYTVHEPEEEKLHRDYHASLHVLRFKGWIDEDIVAIYPEWGNDGRILRINECSHIKRRERLMDILKIVDKELGFSSYIIPKTFVAYIAVRKNQIVGLCLVQPLEKANKYICINGVDCCTEDEFEAKCGISRIWVAPLHRRLHIASKLIYAVQLNTIFGEEISVEKIAFSAPTENGKTFAQKVTQIESFLVYQ